MKKIGKVHLKSASILNENEMKQVLGGSGDLNPANVIKNTCKVGVACTVYDVNDQSTTTGNCQGQFVGGKVECYCDAYGLGSGAGNSNGVSKCYKS